jgi:YD repeat-containing protein
LRSEKRKECRFRRDAEDNLTSITDANGHTTSFAYNARGWVTETTFPSSLIESYNYDAVGYLTSKTDRKGQTITYAYDALNRHRLTSKAYPDSSTVSYTYDLASRLTQVSDPMGTYSFAYDKHGTAIGTRTQLTRPNGVDTDYTYDSVSRLLSVLHQAGSTTLDGASYTRW